MRLKALAVVALLLAGLAVPTAAAVTNDGPASDDAGAVTLSAADGPNGAYATVEDGELGIEFDDLNADAVTRADRVVTVTAQDETVRIAARSDADAVSVYRGDDPSDQLRTRDDAVVLRPGESLTLGIEIDTHDGVSPAALTVVALTPDGEETVDEEDVDVDRRTGPGADEGDEDDEGVGLANETLVDIEGSIDRPEVAAGGTVTATATVTNRGNRTATVTVPFRVDGVTVDERRVRVDGKETRTVTFERRIDRSGEYSLSVGDETIGSVMVSEPDGPAPDFAVTDATVATDEVAVGEPTTVTATVANDGDAEGTFTAELVVDGAVVDSKRVVVAAGESRTVAFERSFREAGDVTVGVSGTTAGTVSVGGGNAELVDPSMLRTSASGAAVAGPLLLGAAIVRRRRRKGL